jgi:hypothetical protein
MKLIKINGIITVFISIPKNFKMGMANYDKLDSSVHIEDGWQDVVMPEYDTGLHKLSDPKEDKNGLFYFELIELTLDEILALEDQKAENILNYLNKVVFSSRLWAKAIVMGKTDKDDLDYFQDVYTTKYRHCKDPNNSFDVFLELERIAEGFNSLEEYKAYVIVRFEQGQEFFEQAKAMIEAFRKIVLKDLEIKNLDFANSRVVALDNLPESITPSEFSVEFQRIISL